MLVSEITKGSKIDVIIRRNKTTYYFTCKVADVRENRIYLMITADSGRAVVLRDTDQVAVIYKNGDIMWTWQKIKAATVNYDGVSMHRLELLDKGKSFNRREAYRIPITEETQITAYHFENTEDSFWVDEEKTVENGDKMVAKGIVKNISETGAAVLTNMELVPHDLIEFKIYDKSKDTYISCTCRVVRVAADEESRYAHMYGCAFVKTDNDIISYIYKKQREVLSKTRK